MNTIKEIERINEEELKRGIAGTSASWHNKYVSSAWCYVGNVDHALTEGDVICVMSQWGEIDDIHLVRDESTGKSRGFAFVKYEDSRSCVLAVDNMVGSTILGRSLRIDHVENYRLPKNVLEKEAEKSAIKSGDVSDGRAAAAVVGGAGHAYTDKEMENKYHINQGVDLFDPNQNHGDNDNYGRDDDRDADDDDDSRKRRSHKRQRKEERKRKREVKEERRRRNEEGREHKDKKKRKKRSST